MHVNAALAAYRTAVSETTGFTPFFLLYGRRAQVPLEAFLSAQRDEFGNRLDDLAVAYQEARENTEHARRYNRARLLERANVDASLRVGDTVVVKAEEALTNTSKWDPQFQVIRVEGTTHWLRHQVTKCGSTRGKCTPDVGTWWWVCGSCHCLILPPVIFLGNGR